MPLPYVKRLAVALVSDSALLWCIALLALQLLSVYLSLDPEERSANATRPHGRRPLRTRIASNGRLASPLHTHIANSSRLAARRRPFFTYITDSWLTAWHHLQNGCLEAWRLFVVVYNLMHTTVCIRTALCVRLCRFLDNPNNWPQAWRPYPILRAVIVIIVLIGMAVDLFQFFRHGEDRLTRYCQLRVPRLLARFAHAFRPARQVAGRCRRYLTAGALVALAVSLVHIHRIHATVPYIHLSRSRDLEIPASRVFSDLDAFLRESSDVPLAELLEVNMTAPDPSSGMEVGDGRSILPISLGHAVLMTGSLRSDLCFLAAAFGLANAVPDRRPDEQTLREAKLGLETHCHHDDFYRTSIDLMGRIGSIGGGIINYIGFGDAQGTINDLYSKATRWEQACSNEPSGKTAHCKRLLLDAIRSSFRGADYLGREAQKMELDLLGALQGIRQMRKQMSTIITFVNILAQGPAVAAAGDRVDGKPTRRRWHIFPAEHLPEHGFPREEDSRVLRGVSAAHGFTYLDAQALGPFEDAFSRVYNRLHDDVIPAFSALQDVERAFPPDDVAYPSLALAMSCALPMLSSTREYVNSACDRQHGEVRLAQSRLPSDDDKYAFVFGAWDRERMIKNAIAAEEHARAVAKALEENTMVFDFPSTGKIRFRDLVELIARGRRSPFENPFDPRYSGAGKGYKREGHKQEAIDGAGE